MQPVNINTGTIFSPYKEFTFKIPAGQIEDVNYVTNNFQLIETSNPSALKVFFGGNSQETTFTQGMEFSTTESWPLTRLWNDSDSDLIIKVGLGVGQITDNRLNLSSGTLNVVEVRATPTMERITIDTTGVAIVNNTGTKAVIQNVSSEKIYIYADDGFEVYPSGSIDCSVIGIFNVYGQEGQQFVVGVFNDV